MNCIECGKPYPEKHHIIFRSQGGLDFDINYKYLCHDCHKEKNGPHKNRKKDLQYKKEMQATLEKTLCKDYYTLEELISILGLRKSQAKKAFNKIVLHKEGYAKEDIIRRLMGGKLYDTSDRPGEQGISICSTG